MEGVNEERLVARQKSCSLTLGRAKYNANGVDATDASPSFSPASLALGLNAEWSHWGLRQV